MGKYGAHNDLILKFVFTTGWVDLMPQKANQSFKTAKAINYIEYVLAYIGLVRNIKLCNY